METKICRTTRLEIDNAELNRRLSDQAEAHVGVCASCAEFRAQRARLRTLVGGLKPVSAPPDFDLRLRARIARDNGSGAGAPSIFRLLVSTPGIVSAALLVAVVGVAVWINQRNTTQLTGDAPPRVATNEKPTNPVRPDIEHQPDTPAAIPTASNDSGDYAKRKITSPRNPKAPLVASGPNQVSDFNSSRAQTFRLTPDRAGEVSLTAPVNPMVVTVRDENGTARKILLPPVSFGSQRLTDNRVPVSMNNSRDW